MPLAHLVIKNASCLPCVISYLYYHQGPQLLLSLFNLDEMSDTMKRVKSMSIFKTRTRKGDRK